MRTGTAYQRLILFLILCCLHLPAWAQRLPKLDSVKVLLTNQTIQIEITSGVDDMYNFKFDRAASQFKWLRRFYPTHPLPYFLLGLNEWWKIVPNIDQTRHDDAFIAYMDSTIEYAEEIFDDDETNPEAPFFLAAAWGFKARLSAERGSWTKAAFYGKKSLKYLDYSKKHSDLSPELLFGDALYNYFSIWIPENYPALKPILIFFDKGDKALGLQQLETVTKDAFYARVEAMYFLMRIYSADENQPHKALRITEYLHDKYPDNPYFHRYYARMLYSLGRYTDLETVSLDILRKIDGRMMGYEETSGRYASFYLASLYRSKKDLANAKIYYKKSVEFSESANANESGYYLFSLSNLARIAVEENQTDLALSYYEKILENADKKHSTYQEAQTFKKEYKKNKRKSNRRS